MFGYYDISFKKLKFKNNGNILTIYFKCKSPYWNKHKRNGVDEYEKEI